MKLSLEALHKYFNKFYLLHNPRVNIGFYNFTQMRCNTAWARPIENPWRDSWSLVAFSQNFLLSLSLSGLLL
jgi:hypothetical protein